MEQKANNRRDLEDVRRMTGEGDITALYTTYVATITANEQRRAQMSSIYLSAFAAVGAAFGALKLDFVYAAAPILVVALIWFASIRYFRRLASAKFKVVAELEALLPYQPFAKEWAFYKGSADPDKEQKKYLGLAHLDMMVPAILALASAGYLIFRLAKSCLG